MRVTVCRKDELAPGQARVVSLNDGRRTIVVGRAQDGEYFAVSGRCPHQGGPMAYGILTGTVASDQVGKYCWSADTVIRCPWHSYDFDAKSGRWLAGEGMRLPTFPVAVEDDNVVIDA
jgi:nitrite reductase/ring-hydroxylating ferredoxin subunit